MKILTALTIMAAFFLIGMVSVVFAESSVPEIPLALLPGVMFGLSGLAVYISRKLFK